YALFVLKILFAVFIAAGFLYRMSTLGFFLTFTYIELLDKTLYLNHNYLVCLLAFYLIFLPAQKLYSIDVLLGWCEEKAEVANIYLLVIKIQLALVYFFAGLAKINPDWLFSGQPLAIWLKTKSTLPFLGELFKLEITAIVMSWTAMLFDLLIPFLLFNKKTVRPAYGILVIFHLFTAVLFPIGMFPWIMIFSTLIFFDFKKFQIPSRASKPAAGFQVKTAHLLLLLMLTVQLIFPMRSLMYRNNSTWYEAGFRFSWKVMKVEKTGSIDFICFDSLQNKKWLVSPREHLSPLQEMQMSYQPDMILEFASFLKSRHKNDIEIYADSWVSMNGRNPQRFIKENIDLSKINRRTSSNTWIYDLQQTPHQQ
ncbi:MAG: HTTM domain-containing protein, partial [Lentisphaeraceae bacterium]|nr:HTTM domain-containing protein [Lentisphaeraceae bacterium]